MIRKIMLIFFTVILLNTMSIQAEVLKNVELFDIKKDSVTNTVPMSSSLQEAAESYLKGINQIYVKVSPIPRSGYMVKIPLEKAILVKNNWMNDLVDEVIIIFPSDEPPFLMVMDDENNPHFFSFKGDTDILVKKLQIQL
jgi:hypothetical protein